MMQPIGQSSKKKIQQSHQKKYLIKQNGILREKSTKKQFQLKLIIIIL